MMDVAARIEAPATWRSRSGFGVGAFGVSLVYMAGGFLQFYFYTKVLGLSPARAGTVLFVGAMSDALIDPVVGWLASRTRTRWGRYRPYLIFGAVPMSLAFIAVYLKPDLAARGLLWYALGSFALFRLSFQLIYMPYTSLIAVLSRDSDERSDIESWRAWFTAAGSLMMTFYGLSLVTRFGGGDDAKGFLGLAMLIAVLTAASFLFTGVVVREITADNPIQDIIDPVRVVRALARNDQFLVVAAATVLSQSAYAMLLSASVNFFEASMGSREFARWPLAASTAAGLVASVFWPVISRHYGKRCAWMAGMLLTALVLIALFLFHPGTTLAYVAAFFLVGSGIQAGLIMQFAAAADSLDYGEWKTGMRTEAVGFAMMTFSMKVSLAIGNGLVGWLFSAVGFQLDRAAAPRILEGMRVIFLAVPAMLFLAAAFVIWFYRISAAKHRDFLGDLERRRLNIRA